MIRVQALMVFLKSNQTVLGGKLEDFWWRIEFQQRGSPHLHMIVWVEGTPDFTSPEGIKRIDEIITCALPDGDNEEEAELKALIEDSQIHRHKDQCYKDQRWLCRYNFPRRVSTSTRFAEMDSTECILNGGRPCVLKRKANEKFVNNYNATLLRLWGANMDIQPCTSSEAIAQYLGKYITKAEPNELNPDLAKSIKGLQSGTGPTYQKFFKICMKILHQRQVSASECVYRLCHLRLRDSSRKCIFLNTRLPEQRYKVITFDEAGQATGLARNLIERYELRPVSDEFHKQSFFEFARRFEVHYEKKGKVIDIDEEDHGDQDAYEDKAKSEKLKFLFLIDGSKMKIRQREAVVRVPYFVESIDPENFYYSLLMQFVPFRNESELLEGYDSAREAFLAREEQLREKSSDYAMSRHRDHALEIGLNKAVAFKELQEYQVNDEEPLEEEQDLEDFNMDNEHYENSIRSMNVGQKELFGYIQRQIKIQLAGNESQLLLFITGGAGTGKTFVLNMLRQLIVRCHDGFHGSVVVCALTGKAAKLVNGLTIHSVFKLPVEKDGKLLRLPLLTGPFLKVMRMKWREVKWLIIDEISMISYEMLCMLNSRLQQLKDSVEVFGGINILFFGDLMQLPPIRGSFIFRQPERLEGSTDLWRLFSFCELTQNMRQKGDQTFMKLLNELRMGDLKFHETAIFHKKVISRDEKKSGDFAVDKALRIFPTLKQVELHNKEVLEGVRKTKKIKIYTILAQDTLDSMKNVKKGKIEQVIPKDINKTGGLPKKLECYVGSKIMLRYNVSTPKGLVNGAMGIIVEFHWPNLRRDQVSSTDIPCVNIEFDGVGRHIIEPMSVQFPALFSCGTVERRQLPFIIANATTIHKMQGSTIDTAVVYLGRKIFARGMAYVALSRLRSLDGLRLDEFDATKVVGKSVCNLDALKEMNRLRELPDYRDPKPKAVKVPEIFQKKSTDNKDDKLVGDLKKASTDAAAVPEDFKMPAIPPKRPPRKVLHRSAVYFRLHNQYTDSTNSVTYKDLCGPNSLMHAFVYIAENERDDKDRLRYLLSHSDPEYKFILDEVRTFEEEYQLQHIAHYQAAIRARLSIDKDFNVRLITENGKFGFANWPDMSQLIDLMLPAHKSYDNIYQCPAPNCTQRMTSSKRVIMVGVSAPAILAGSLANRIEMNLQTLSRIKRCPTCNIDMKVTHTNFHEILFIYINYDIVPRNQTVPLNLFDRVVKLTGGIWYDLRAVIDNQNGVHFVVYCMDNDAKRLAYRIDDTKGREERLENDAFDAATVTPAMLIFVRQKTKN